jgi:hypothetical protein
MASNPELTDETIRQNLRRLAEKRRATFIYHCQRLDSRTGEGPPQSEIGAALGIAQGTVSENLKAAFKDLKIPWPGKTKEEDLNPPDVEKRLEMLRRYSEVIKADYPIDTQPDLPPQPAPEPAKSPSTQNGDIDNIFANVRTGEAPPAPQRTIHLPIRDALIFAGVLLLAGGFLSFFFFRPTANQGATEAQPTQTARVEVLTQTVIVMPSPQVTVIVETPAPLPTLAPYPTQEPLPTLAPVIIVVTATPPPATATPTTTATPEISPTPAPTETPVATETPAKPLALPFKDSFTDKWRPEIQIADGEAIIENGWIGAIGGSSRALVLQLGDKSLNNYSVDFDYSRFSSLIVELGPTIRLVWWRNGGGGLRIYSEWHRFQDGQWVKVSGDEYNNYSASHVRVTVKGDVHTLEGQGQGPVSVTIPGATQHGPIRIILPPSILIDNLEVSSAK